MKNTNLLKIKDGIPYVRTKSRGTISIIGMFVNVLEYVKDKPRFFDGWIRAVSGNRVQILIPSRVPSIPDRVINTTLDGPWEFVPFKNSPIEIVEHKSHEQKIIVPCKRTRNVLSPRTLTYRLVQCAYHLGHPGACHFFLPSIKQKENE